MRKLSYFLVYKMVILTTKNGLKQLIKKEFLYLGNSCNINA